LDSREQHKGHNNDLVVIQMKGIFLELRLYSEFFHGRRELLHDWKPC
jgi:hypothetical protein